MAGKVKLKIGGKIYHEDGGGRSKVKYNERKLQGKDVSALAAEAVLLQSPLLVLRQGVPRSHGLHHQEVQHRGICTY
jgi:hypothetical protein